VPVNYFPKRERPKPPWPDSTFISIAGPKPTKPQDIATPEGSYWHAIVHRQEPDAGNSAYWFRQVGAHAIFPALRDAAAEIGIPVGPRWNPQAFIDLCERAGQSPGSELERQAREVQRAEWQLLFDYCARP